MSCILLKKLQLELQPKIHKIYMYAHVKNTEQKISIDPIDHDYIHPHMIFDGQRTQAFCVLVCPRKIVRHVCEHTFSIIISHTYN